MDLKVGRPFNWSAKSLRKNNRDSKYPEAAPKIIPTAEVSNPRENPKTADAAIMKGLAGNKQRLEAAIRTANKAAPTKPSPPSQAETCSSAGTKGKK